jgi:hypothetical protein
VGAGGRIETGLTDVTDAGREAVAEELHEREEMIGETGGIGVVLPNFQFAFVVQQTVEDPGRVAVTDVHEAAVEGRVLVADVGVDEPAGVRVDSVRRRIDIVEAVTEPNGTIVWGTPKSHASRSVSPERVSDGLCKGLRIHLKE